MSASSSEPVTGTWQVATAGMAGAPGLGEQVTPVELRVGAGLLDHEDLHPELEQLVKGPGVEVLGPAAARATVIPQPRQAVAAVADFTVWRRVRSARRLRG